MILQGKKARHGFGNEMPEMRLEQAEIEIGYAIRSFFCGDARKHFFAVCHLPNTTGYNRGWNASAFRIEERPGVPMWQPPRRSIGYIVKGV
jgi:hypothetical protein